MGNGCAKVTIGGDGDQVRKGYHKRWGPGAQGLPYAIWTRCAKVTISDGVQVRKGYRKRWGLGAQELP